MEQGDERSNFSGCRQGRLDWRIRHGEARSGAIVARVVGASKNEELISERW